MREHIWRPSKFKTFEQLEDGTTKEIEKEPLFEGSVKMQIPKYRQRLKYIKECNFQQKGDAVEQADQYAAMEKMIDLAAKHVKEVDLCRIDDGMEFKSLEDLEYDQEGSELLNQIAGVILGGVRLGKS